MNWAFVTGGGGDIGGAICHALARDGWAIACVDMNEARAAQVVGDICAGGGTAVALTADVTYPQAVAAAAGAAMALGDVRALVNTAGKAHGPSIFGMDYVAWRADFAFNLDSAFLCVQALRDQLISKGGSIVNIASVNGVDVLGFPGYSAAKAALLHLTKALAVEFGPYNLRVNAVSPGTVRTRAWDARLAANPGVFDELLALCPLERVSSPADVANAVAFLVSDKASMITGTTVTVDGGLTAGVPALSRTVTQQPRRV